MTPNQPTAASESTAGPAVDAKAAFYFQHREQIEEWAALRADARRLLDDALTTRLGGLTAPNDQTLVVSHELVSGAYPRVGFQHRGWLPAEVEITVSIGWTRGQLLSPSGTSWPYLGLHLTNGPMSKDDRATVRTALRATAIQLGWTLSEQAWPWWQVINPEPGEFDPNAYTQRCLTQLTDAWPTVAPVITAAVTGT